MSVVFDTNVLISALMFGGNPRRILELVIHGEPKLVLSEPLLDELKGLLQRPKFGFPPAAIQAILSDLTAIGHIVRPSISINQIIEDPQDNRILECAVEGDADYIISGDT